MQSTNRSPKPLIPRVISFMGGTTDWSDCVAALRYMATPAHLIQGPTIRKYEQAFARKIGVRYAFSFSSGRVGLYGILKALAVGATDEVLLQAPTHIVVPNAIRYTGARPVYADCRLDNYTIDLDRAAQQITRQTKVLLVQHTYGIPTDMDAALALAEQHGLVVIEDCVHALGSTYGGRYVGTIGQAGFFSTEETKTISTTMGGMVVTDDPTLAHKLQSFQAQCHWPTASLTYRYLLKLAAYHLLLKPTIYPYSLKFHQLIGRRNPLPRPTLKAELYGQKPAAYEQRLSNAQAVLGLRQLARLDQNVAHRRTLATLYNNLLANSSNIRLPKVPAKAEPAYLRYPIWVEDKAQAYERVRDDALLGTWFSTILMEAVSDAHGEYTKGACPNAELATNAVLNLPVHLNVQPTDARRIVQALQRAPI